MSSKKVAGASSSKVSGMRRKQDAPATLTPKLRFPEFRDAAGWEEKALETRGKFTGGGTPSKENATHWTGENPWVSSSDISEDSISEIKITRFITEEAIRESATKIVPANSILLISRVGVGKLAVTTKPICTSQDFTSFTPAEDDLLFLAYFLKRHKETLLSFNQGTSIKGFTKDNIASLELGFPSPAEQQKIAECLTTLDEVIAAQSQKLDALKTHKKGLMQQLFPREGETLPRLRFPEFQDAPEWEVEPFDKLIEVVDGDRGVNYPKIDDFSQSGFCLFLSAKNVTKTGFKFEEMQFISSEKDKELRKGKLKRADVVLTTRGTVGQFAYYADEIPYENIRINSGMVILRIKIKKIAPDYLYNFTSSELLSSHIKIIAFGNAQQQITVGEIKKFKFYYPRTEEQQRIASCLTTLDDLIAAHSAKLSALKTHKRGLMQQLFPSPEEVEA